VRPARAADHSPLLVPGPWKSRAIPLPLLGHTGPVTGSLYLYITVSTFTTNRVVFDLLAFAFILKSISILSVLEKWCHSIVLFLGL